MNIVLIGMKYTGKSTLGVELARLRSMAFRDTDQVMESIYAERNGSAMALRDIYAQRGADFFDALELDAVRAVAEEVSGIGGIGKKSPMVVSLGGRCPLNRPAAALLGQIGPVVYLRNSVEVLLGRLAAAPLPAFLKAEDAAGQFREIYNSRKGVYDRLADAVVDLDGLDIPASLDKLTATVDELANERNS